MCQYLNIWPMLRLHTFKIFHFTTLPYWRYLDFAELYLQKGPDTAAMGSLPNPLHPSFLERLDADFIEYYNQYLAVKPATHTVSISDIRAAPKLYAMPWYKDFSYESFVNDIKIKSDDGHMFTARCYQPDARTSPFGAGPYPVYINFHGKFCKAKRGLATSTYIYQVAATLLVI